MDHVLLDLEVTRVDLVDDGANSESFIKIYKRKEEGGKPMTLEEILASLEEEQANVIRDAIDAAAAEAAEKIESLEKKLEELKEQPEDEEFDEEEILKGLDPRVKEIVEKARLKAAAAEAAIKKMAEQEAEATAIAKAKEVSNVGVPQDTLKALFKKLDAEVLDEVFEILKTASRQIGVGKSFEEIGKSGGGYDGDGAEAWAKIEKKAKSLCADGKMTMEAAVSKVIEQEPELYRQYVNSN